MIFTARRRGASAVLTGGGAAARNARPNRDVRGRNAATRRPTPPETRAARLLCTTHAARGGLARSSRASLYFRLAFRREAMTFAAGAPAPQAPLTVGASGVGTAP